MRYNHLSVLASTDPEFLWSARAPCQRRLMVLLDWCLWGAHSIGGQVVTRMDEPGFDGSFVPGNYTSDLNKVSVVNAFQTTENCLLIGHIYARYQTKLKLRRRHMNLLASRIITTYSLFNFLFQLMLKKHPIITFLIYIYIQRIYFTT